MINNIAVILGEGRLGDRKNTEHIGNVHTININTLVFVLDGRLMNGRLIIILY